MYLYDQLLQRAAAHKPVRVGLIGAGKFGSMFLSQVPTTPALTVSDRRFISRQGAGSCAAVGWPTSLIEATNFTDDAGAMMASGAVDVVVEATGNPVIGARHAQQAIKNGLHIVMVMSRQMCWQGRHWRPRRAKQG